MTCIPRRTARAKASATLASSVATTATPSTSAGFSASSRETNAAPSNGGTVSTRISTRLRAASALNPSISRDLDVVVTKALEKDRRARYATAAEFAADLEAVLALRPIRARPPGPGRRLWSWARRHRGAAAAVVMGVLALAGVGVTLLVQARLAERERERQAVEAIAETAERLATYRRDHESVERLEFEVDHLNERIAERYLEPAVYARLDRIEAEFRSSRVERERDFYAMLELLNRAERLDPDAPRLHELRAELLLEKVFEALWVRDYQAAELWEQEVARWDDGSVRSRLYPFAGVRLDVDGAEYPVDVYPFRYREEAELSEGGRLRQVPVPLKPEDLPVVPGTWCLRVVRAAGELREEDLIVSLAGHPIEGSALVARGAGEVRAGDRLVSVDGAPVLGDWEIDLARRRDTGGAATREFAFERGGTTYALRAGSLGELGVEVLEPGDLARRGGTPAAVYRGGTVFETVLPEGLDVRTTSLPLLVSEANRVSFGPDTELSLEPGEYLLLIRKPGYESLRLPVELNPGPTARFAVELVPEGTTPPDCVRVTCMGEDGAITSFWILEREVTSAEYREFLSDPETLAEIEASPDLIRVPRDPGNVFWERKPDGSWGPTAAEPDWRMDWPALGVSYDDARAFARWRTRRARAAGLEVTWRLPTEREHVTAALGNLPRYYPWGNRWRAAWANTCFAKPRALPEPGLRYPIDESPYGAYDLCGSASEWHADAPPDAPAGSRGVSGGAWDLAAAATFQTAAVRHRPEEARDPGQGFRLVLRRAGP